MNRSHLLLPAIALLAVGCSQSAPEEDAAAPEEIEQPVDPLAEPAEPEEAAPAYDSEAVTAFLRGYAEDAGATGDMPTRVAVAAIPDTDLVAAYLMGPFWCGSGGCNLLVLRPGEGEGGFDILGDISVAQTPIRVLSTSSEGMPDLGVAVRGGGSEAYEARLAFDGEAYPGNPTVPPAQRIDDAEGEVLIGEEERGEPLFE